MKYLFFDLECADGNYEICEFGYVLSTPSFEVLEQRNILMDPEGEFRLSGRYGQSDLKLTYSEEEYRANPPFPERYEEIRSLLTQDDVMVFGYGVNNDIVFLAKDCRSYELDFFSFHVRDIQRYLGLTAKFNAKRVSLERAYEILCPDGEPFHEHRAMDDAYATMKVLEAVMKETGKNIEELAALVPSSNLESLEYMEERRHRNDEIHQSQLRQARMDQNRAWWKKLVEETPKIKVGKTIYCSNDVFASEDAFALLLSVAMRAGFVPNTDFFNTDLYVVMDEEEKRSLAAIVKGKTKSQIITLEELTQDIL